MSIGNVYPRYWHSAVTVAVRNLVRCPLNYVCTICDFFFPPESGMTVFGATPMLLRMSVRCPMTGKGQHLAHTTLMWNTLVKSAIACELCERVLCERHFSFYHVLQALRIGSHCAQSTLTLNSLVDFAKNLRAMWKSAIVKDTFLCYFQWAAFSEL